MDYEKIIYLPDNIPPKSLPCEEAKGFTELIANISARLVASPAEQLDKDITGSLAEVFKCLNADRGGILTVKDDPFSVHVSHAWFGGDNLVVPPELNVAELFPWFFKKVVNEKYIMALARCDELPQEAVVDRANLGGHGVVSTLAVPLASGDRVRHIFGIDSVNFEREWPPEIIRNIKLLGEVFVNALCAREQEQQLLQYKERMEVAAASADAGLWELDRKTGHFWVGTQARKMFNYSADEEVTMENFLEKVCPESRSSIVEAIDQISTPEDELFIEYRVLVNDVEDLDRWMCSRGRLVPTTNNEHNLLTGVTVEITRQKIFEQELEGRLDEIQELREQLEHENLYLREEVSLNREKQDLLGDSEKMRLVMEQVEQVARTDSTVLIQGETGTGKELLAQTIHQMSDRANRVMVKVNCAALPEALVESELFGREKGAYTGSLSMQVGRFELADGSTLFLDEISEMPLDTQAKLLRVLQEGELERLGSPRTIKVDVRVIVASNRDLSVEVEQGRFRRDLYYRLNVFPITLPPLRERPGDVPQLVWTFVNEFNDRMGKKVRNIPKPDMVRLQSYSWPGNVRELRNVIEHSMIISLGEVLNIKRLDDESPQNYDQVRLEDVECQHILKVLEMTQGRIKGQGGASELLDINPSTLYSRMHKLGIERPRS